MLRERDDDDDAGEVVYIKEFKMKDGSCREFAGWLRERS